MSIYNNRDAQRIETGAEVGRGGEGVVYKVIDHDDLVAKIYHPAQRTADRQAKLAAMVARPPQDRCRTFTPPHVSVAWPTDLLFAQGNFVGFLMPRIERSPNIFALFHPKLRRQRYPQANRRFLHHTAQNLAALLATLHDSAIVMGDVNQKNILAKTNTLVTVVDTDSFQIQDASGHIHRCPVGVPEYTPPELQNKPLGAMDRQPFHDCFGLSVLLFQLLMEGYHPFTGRPLSSALAEMDQLSLHCMQQGFFPYCKNGRVQPPPDAPPFTQLDPELQKFFLQSFLDGHTAPANRPTAIAWAQALHHAERNLVQCRHHADHWYGNHLGECPDCRRRKWVAASAHATVMPRSQVLAAQNQTRYTQTSATQLSAQLGALPGKAKALGGLYLLPFLLMLLVNNPGWFPVIVLLFALLNGWVRRKLWLALEAFGGWLLPILWQSGQALLAYWASRTAIFKAAALVSFAMVAVIMLSTLSEPSSTSRKVDPMQSPLAVSPLATPGGDENAAYP